VGADTGSGEQKSKGGSRGRPDEATAPRRPQSAVDKRTPSPPSIPHRRRRRGVGGTCPPKFGKTYFSGNYYVKFGHFDNLSHIFFGQNVVPPKVD